MVRLATRFLCRTIVLLVLCFPALSRPQEADDDTQPAEPAAEPAAEPVPVSLFDFEGDEPPASWTAQDQEATFSITREKQNVANGNGALEFAYTASPGKFQFQQISTNGFGAESANALSLKIKASSPTSISLGVQEQGGAQYQGLLWIDRDTWTNIRVPLDDLILTQNSEDEDGAPSGDQVTGFFLADLANLQGEVGQALGRKDGDQKLWLDDVALVHDANMPSRGRAAKLGNERLLVLDDFEGDVVWGLPVRRAGLKLVKGAPKAKGKRALEITYRLGIGRWVGYVLAPPGRFDLSTATKFHMWAKTDLNARLVIVIEESDGTKYDTAAKVPADGKWHATLIPFADFAPAEEGGDENNRLDSAEISRVIVLIDTFDADVRPGGAGSVSIDDIGLVTAEAPGAGEGG